MARYCLNYHLNGEVCEKETYRLINDCQAAFYIEPVVEGNNVECEGSHSVPSRPRESSLELLENRLKTVGEDPNHTLCKRLKFCGRQFEFIGNSPLCMTPQHTVTGKKKFLRN